MLSCLRRPCFFLVSRILSSHPTVSNNFAFPVAKVQTGKRLFHVNFPIAIQATAKLITKYYDSKSDENLNFVVVKAPPGASETSVPGKIEWAKTVGSRVKIRELVCTIRFRDGRKLEVAAPVEGIIAARLKMENEPISHGDELFKIRLDPKGHIFQKRKLKKTTSLDVDEEDDISHLAETQARKSRASLSKITTKDTTESSKVGLKEKKESSDHKGSSSKASGSHQDNVPWNQSAFRGGDQDSPLKQFRSSNTFSIPSLMTVMDEVNLESTLKFLENYDSRYYVHKPSIRSLYLKATAFVLKMQPKLNIKIHNEEKIQKTDIDITVAIRHLQNLALHTFKNVDKTSYHDLGRVLRDVRKQMAEGTYRQGKDSIDFTMSQEWEIGSVFGTPHFSKTCTLGLHKIIKRPVLVEDKVVAHSMMYVSLTYDNVLINDKDATDFLRMFKFAIEEPRYILVNAE